MKSLIVLIAVALLSSSTYSQDLTPTVQRSGNDTLLCFTVGQSKYIAKQVVHAQYCDSIVGSLNKQKASLIEARERQTDISKALNEKVKNLNIMLSNDSTIIEVKDLQIAAEKKEVKRQKRQKIFAVFLAVITGVAGILT